MDDLNQLSWDNGLEILATLDALNHQLNELEVAGREAGPDRERLTKAQMSVNKTVREVNALLQDRKKIASAAAVLKVNNLFSPEYEEYLHDTMSKVTAMKPAQESSTGSLVQQQAS